LWALVSGHWVAWQAARVEVAQKQDEERRASQDMSEELVEHLVTETIPPPLRAGRNLHTR
jgi:hypothetical protein